MAVSSDLLNGLTEYAAEDILKLLRDYNNMDSVADVLSSTSRALGAGSDSSRFQDMFYGFNRLAQLPNVPVYTENQGMIFFTRPELNLSYNNISGVRRLTPFAESEEVNQTAHAVKCALDPITQKNDKARKSKLIDMRNPYLTYFSNLCLTMNQPPDIGIEVHTSPEGMMKEQWMIADGVVETNGYFDISCTFNNVPGNPIPMTIYAWLWYIHHLRFGPCVPHPENRQSGRMDYFSRIERFTFDHTGRYIEQWWHTGAALPKNMSAGAYFGYNKLEPTNLDNKQTTVQFACVGSIINDPIQLVEFNMRMMRWNINLRDEVRAQHYIKIHPGDLGITNYYGYPLIDLNTREMTWWIDRDELAYLTKGQRNDSDKALHADRIAKNSANPGRFNPYVR